MKSIYIYDKKVDGHREDYLKYFASELNAKYTTRITWRKILCDKLFLITADDYIFSSFFLSLFRSLLLKQTKLVFIRAHNWNTRFTRFYKLFFLIPLRFMLFVKSIIIQPRVGINKILFSDEIVDPAVIYSPISEKKFIILSEQELKKKFSSGNQQSNHAKQFDLVFLGAFSYSRNIHKYLSLYSKYPCIRLFSVGANKIGLTLTKQIIKRLPLIEILASLDEASILWCCFDGSYDNSSGFFWMAFKNNLPMLINNKSKFIMSLRDKNYLDFKISKVNEHFSYLVPKGLSIDTIREINLKALK